MSIQKTALVVVLLLAAPFFSFLSSAQVPVRFGDFKITAIHQQLVVPPNYSALAEGLGTSGSSLSKKWLRIETDFSSVPEWADDVSVKYYVLIGRGRQARMFGGEVTYINVQQGQHHLSAMFMHPNTIQRYGQGNVEAVHVELWYQGTLMDQANSPAANVAWWQGTEPIQGFLLTPQQTPWSVTAFDRYEESKPAQSQ
jgi:hypothetical protein